ncbi:hypothetical protein [Pontibacillus salipaludis]|uniref:Uncharacterized protein n=1 Tax=Pontibacillus salipaludis TaxID=1697394 RepID=A0ABQ1PWM7_9BACI|nr:hypothetical protein [Pontibacillus salipaludis]GGD05457.1 hypothetical protein GCM10011389_11210 [Pontibacillus salipaludis]
MTRISDEDNQLLVEQNPRTINGIKMPAIEPQHNKHGTNRFERTEGSDGALHTKIVDSNGNPLFSANLPGTVEAVGKVREGVNTSALSVGSAPTKLGGVSGRRLLKITPIGEEIFIGDASVSISNGFPVLPGETQVITFDPTNPVDLYGIASQSTQVKILETY